MGTGFHSCIYATIRSVASDSFVINLKNPDLIFG